MIVTLEHISKRYNYDWIFRDVNHTFAVDKPCAIIGPNGSGKSTLIKVIAGQLTPSSGNLIYTDSAILKQEEIFSAVSYAAPYLDIIDEFTLEEMITFHFSFKKRQTAFSNEDVIALSGLEKHRKKQIKAYSSGMRQRVKLVLALCADTPVLLLDEPTTNLDAAGVEWYLNGIERCCQNRLVIVGSNIEREYTFCRESMNIMDFKSAM